MNKWCTNCPESGLALLSCTGYNLRVVFRCAKAVKIVALYDLKDMIGREFTNIRSGLVHTVMARYVFLILMPCLLFWHGANAQNADNMGICGRTYEVQYRIIDKIEAEDCSAVTDHALSTIIHLDIRHILKKKIKADDFSGLGNLQELSLEENQLSELPEGIFEGLDNLQDLYLPLLRNGM